MRACGAFNRPKQTYYAQMAAKSAPLAGLVLPVRGAADIKAIS